MNDAHDNEREDRARYRRIMTDQAIEAFRKVETKRLQLEAAEYALEKELRFPHDINLYFAETEKIRRQSELKRANMAALKVGDAAHNAEAIYKVLRGEKTAFRDIVVLNSAAALVVAGKASDLRQGAELAVESIDSGKAAAALATLKRVCA